MYYSELDTRFCKLILVGDRTGLKQLHMDTGEGNRSFEFKKNLIRNDKVFEDVRTQLEAYMDGRLSHFKLKLNPDGTSYQKSVWNILSSIPYGELWSYKDVATKSGNPKASRAVGAANGKNPIPIIVPCHRVIGADGQLTGFAFGIKVKQQLIDFELMMTVYNLLLKAYDHQDWWPADTSYEMMIGAILTQNTSWNNVELALANFDDHLSPETIESISEEQLQSIIKPSGFYTQKAERIKALTFWFKSYDYEIGKVHKQPMAKLRKELLAIKGIGGETADAILLYAAKKPSFVIDAYTRRIFSRLGMTVPREYEAFRNRFMEALPVNELMFNNYHALLVEHAKRHCKTTPNCYGCPLYNVCQIGKKLI